MTGQRIIRQRRTKNLTRLVFYWPATVGRGVHPYVLCLSIGDTFCLGIGVRVLFPFQFWSPLWLRPVRTLTFCYSLHEFIRVSVLPCFEGFFPLDVLHPHWLTIFSPLPQGSLRHEHRDLMGTYRLGLTVVRPLTFSPLSHCGSLLLFPAATGRSFSDDSWTRYWPMSAPKCQESVFIDSLSREIETMR